jgi:2,3-dihydroxybenzoate-AMP ligase
MKEVRVPLDGVVPFPAEDAQRWRARGYWEDRLLGDVFAETFQQHGDRVAIVHEEERITYRSLGERVERLACHLLDLGIGPLDRVVMHLPNIPEFVYLYFALQRVGSIPLMALPGHRRREISYYLEFIEAKGYAIADRGGRFDFVEFAKELQASGVPVGTVFVSGRGRDGLHGIAALLESDPEHTPGDLRELTIDPDDPCIFQLSGGTTGIPKVIPRTHNDYVYNTRAAAAVNDIRPDDKLLVVLPIAHNFPLACPGIQGFMLAGGQCVLTTSTRADEVLRLISAERITHVEIVPALMIRWLSDPVIETLDLSSVRVINSGGQKFQVETKRRAERAFSKSKVQEVFGMAEGLLTYSRLDDSREVRWETVGRPVCPDDEVKLLDENDEEVTEPGEIGELLCRGPYTLRGYFKSPEHNARAFTTDGFYRTGDLMSRHPTGNLVVEGRKKDLINRGGEKISAEEIENLILSHPAVKEIACVPMPDPVLGERMCAYLVLRPGATIDLSQLVDFLGESGIARFKLPERLEFLPELPISNFGKVAKNRLTEMIALKLAAEGVPATT